MKEEIEELLGKMQLILNKNNSFVVSDREKNNYFCCEYSLSSKIIKKILKNLTIFDFVKVMDNCHKGYVDEKLYLFAPKLELVNSYGEKEVVQIYLKINYVCNMIIIVSLHKCNYTLRYAF